MAKNLELRLIDAPVPSGEVTFRDLAALTSALQELTTRIGRDVMSTPGPGRTKQFMEEFAQLRLRGVASGSTVLQFSKGTTDKLDVDLREQELADERFWEIIEAISADRRPEWVTDLIAESAAKLVTALRDAAPRAELTDPQHATIRIDSDRIHSETWTTKPVQTGTLMEARGRLEKVDLRTHEFRVRDDVGHGIDLKHVSDDNDVARLVGQWVLAEGEGVLAAGRLVALTDVTITALTDPARAHEHDTLQSVEDLLESAPGPDPAGGLDLTEDEFTAFLQAARA